MESDSQPSSPIQRPSNLFADVVGTCIALLTLTLPFVVIGHYSSDSSSITPPSYTIQLID